MLLKNYLQGKFILLIFGKLFTYLCMHNIHLEKSALEQQPTTKGVNFADFWWNNCDDEIKLLKHVSTRRLLLNKYLVRLFDQWYILVSNFKEVIIQNKSVKISKEFKVYVIPKRVETDQSYTNKKKCEESLSSINKKICKIKICETKILKALKTV